MLPCLVALAIVVVGQVPDSAAGRGRKLVQGAQCNRCHTIQDLPPPPREQSCTACHQWIVSTSQNADDNAQAAQVFPLWKRHVGRVSEGHFTQGVPSLVAVGRRLEGRWLKAYLTDPHDLRPHLSESMVRTAFTPAQLEDVVAFLMRDVQPADGPAIPQDRASIQQGEALFSSKGCVACHLFGARRLAGMDKDAFTPSPHSMKALAPDLRHTRDRFQQGVLVRWIMDPQAIKPDSPMPRLGVTLPEAQALAAFILLGDLGTPLHAPKPAIQHVSNPARPTWEDVDERVFSRVCIHCHMDPSLNDGDGGPGNTGGLGYPARGLSFSSYEDVVQGSLDDHGEPRSMFTAGKSGRPLLLERLHQRTLENGRDRIHPGGVPAAPQAAHPPGMPMGLPALSAADLALVETWVAQGHPGPRQPSHSMSAYYGP